MIRRKSRTAVDAVRQLAPTAAVTPLPINARQLRHVRTLLLVGGTFDPPHRMHVSGAVAALGSLHSSGQAVALLIPAARSPHKDRAPVASDQHRLAMLRLIETPHLRVWTDEIDRALLVSTPTASFTIDTVTRLRTLCSRTIKLRLLIGADQAAAFHRWKSARRLFATASPLVLLRAPIDTPAKLSQSLTATGYWKSAELRRWSELIADVPPQRIASTSIRAAIARTRLPPERWSTHRVLRGVDPSVSSYIVRHGLYGASHAG